jgi:hypothetical protein
MDGGNTQTTSPGFGVNRSDVFSKPSAGSALPSKYVAIGLALVVLVAGGYFAYTSLATKYAVDDGAPAVADVDPALAKKAAFIDKVDRVCLRGFNKAKGLMYPDTLPQLSAWAASLIAIQKDIVGDIKVLKAPARHRKLFDKWVRGVRGQIAFTQTQLVPAIEALDVARVNALSKKAEKRSYVIGGLALRYGLHDCRYPRSLYG